MVDAVVVVVDDDVGVVVDLIFVIVTFFVKAFLIDVQLGKALKLWLLESYPKILLELPEQLLYEYIPVHVLPVFTTVYDLLSITNVLYIEYVFIQGTFMK